MSTRWQLAIECSSTGGSVALLKIEPPAVAMALFSQNLLPSDRGSVQSLAPAIEQSLNQAQLRIGDLEFLSVTIGPGSFTGLRVGLATAKMLAMACAKPIAPVDTLAAIALRFANEARPAVDRPTRLVTAINAYRKQVFTASWFIDASGVHNVRPSSVIDVPLWQANPWGADTPISPGRLATSDEGPTDEIWITGPALETYPITSIGDAAYRSAPVDLWQPMAQQVGMLGWEAIRQGRALSAAELLPNYIRPSAAEEKRQQKA